VSETSDIEGKSFLFLALVPFAINSTFRATSALLGEISIVFGSTDLNCRARALALAAALAQTPKAAATLADQTNIRAAKTFLHGAPDHFVYTALRFLLAVAPFLPPEQEARDAIDATMDLVLASHNAARITLIATQFLASLPRIPAWDVILADSEIEMFVSLLKVYYSDDERIMIVAKLLDERCS
jgi:hypothetical protein